MNLWILTEEKPKKEVIVTILEKYLKDRNIACFIDNIRIIPILENSIFTFKYEIIGFKTPKISNIYIKIISGTSSFIDFLVFKTINEPTQSYIFGTKILKTLGVDILAKSSLNDEKYKAFISIDELINKLYRNNII